MNLAAPWLLASLVTALACIAITRMVGGSPMEPPMARSHEPTAYAQAINVVQIHPNREIVQQSVRTIEETKRLVENSNAR